MKGELFSLTGAYVLDALDDDERVQFEDYLETSAEARAEVRSLREVTTRLAAGVAETPPDGMKDRVLQRIDTVRQDRPVVPLEAPATRRRRQPPESGRDHVAQLLYGVAAAAVIIAVGLGVAVAQLASRIDTIQQTSQQVAAVVGAEDAQRVSAPLDDGGSLTAVVTVDQGAAIVVGHDLTALPDDQVYAVWAMVGEQPIPAGELVVGEPLIMTSPEMDAIAVTVEPRGPLSTPTGEIRALLSV